MPEPLTLILPARNEAGNLKLLLPRLRAALPRGAEILVIDDGSTDDTPSICRNNGARVISHPYPMGNGAAIKTGARNAKGESLVFMDADGQHDPADVPRLLERLDEGFDMAVGARVRGSQAGLPRSLANRLYNRFASWMVGHRVEDLTSGFRAVRASRFQEFLHLLPNGFSYPTTITMAFFRSGYPVAYVPIHATRRKGKSHIHPLRDGIRFLLIIFRVGVLYSPLKLFLPISLFHAISGIGYYTYTYLVHDRLSMATIFMLTTAVMIFLIGMVSEQLTALHYSLARNPGNVK